MIDKEKQIFEKWFKEKKEKCEVYGNGDDFYVDDEIKKFCLMGYELGLKAGRPQWHYVKDGDLPKEDLRQRTHGYYLTASKHKSYKGFVFEVAYFTGVVFIKGGDILDNVIAWKEIVLTELPKEE